MERCVQAPSVVPAEIEVEKHEVRTTSTKTDSERQSMRRVYATRTYMHIRQGYLTANFPTSMTCRDGTRLLIGDESVHVGSETSRHACPVLTHRKSPCTQQEEESRHLFINRFSTILPLDGLAPVWRGVPAASLFLEQPHSSGPSARRWQPRPLSSSSRRRRYMSVNIRESPMRETSPSASQAKPAGSLSEQPPLKELSPPSDVHAPAWPCM